jgi:hypothetical protein
VLPKENSQLLVEPQLLQPMFLSQPQNFQKLVLSFLVKLTLLT